MELLSVIIPAAGAGKRMNTDIPKPFIKVAGKTILEHTIARFAGYPQLVQIIIAAQKSYMSEIEEVAEKYVSDRLRFSVVEGAQSRQGSVYNALQEVDERAGLVAVHDAVRPFVSQNQIRACCAAAQEFGAAVPGVPAKDTIKKVNERHVIVETPDRTSIWHAQTPQVFRKELLIKAYEMAIKNSFIGTDDASLVEYAGGRVKMVEGEQENFKITFPVDFKLAELLLEEGG